LESVSRVYLFVVADILVVTFLTVDGLDLAGSVRLTIVRLVSAARAHLVVIVGKAVVVVE